ncbi:MAG TPA: hypothetical protein VNZ52_06885 [Candidatus Thermoplasmatota archaeon]|nr:hypothetical protein [Candidatus Thermoplasmatota archaeon]
MSRVRSYQTNVLNPIGGRGNPTEVVLIGHLHTDAAGKVTRVEGFLGSGMEGKAWAESAYRTLEGAGLLAAGAELNSETPLRGCPHAGLR